MGGNKFFEKISGERFLVSRFEFSYQSNGVALTVFFCCRCTVCEVQSDDEHEMHRHLQDEHLELPKCRKEDLFSLLQFYKPSMDLKSWDDYVGQMAPGKGQKTRLESVMNGNAKK